MFASRWARRDEGSMPLALLVTLVGVTLSASVSGLVMSQLRESRTAADRVAAVAAAQAGLDAGLARIRSAVTSLVGDLTKLPCDVITPPANSGQPPYRASIGYFLVDPSAKAGALAPIGDLTNLSRLTSGTPVATLLAGLGVPAAPAVTDSLNTALSGAVGCVNGVLTEVPRFGLLRSSGTVGGTTRTLYATYKFRNAEELIPGGGVVIAGTDNKLCIGAPSVDPKTGNPVVAVPCTADPRQVKMIYPRNLSLSLAESRTAADLGVPYGLCVTAPALQFNGAGVFFAPCVAPKTALQQWKYEVNLQTYYGTVNGTGNSGYCLNVDTPVTAGKAVVLRNGGNCGKANTTGKAFVPDFSVGSGAASVNTGQLVNYAEVGQCLDLTKEDPDGTFFTSQSPPKQPALITYPCKQDFSGVPFWNHRWTAPAIPKDGWSATGQITITPTQGKYVGVPFCLKSPGSIGGFPWVEKCSAGGADQRWTVSGAAPLDRDAYLIKDVYGMCLTAAGSLGAAYKFDGKYSMVITTPCTNAESQKWNKPRSADLGPLSSIKER